MRAGEVCECWVDGGAYLCWVTPGAAVDVDEPGEGGSGGAGVGFGGEPEVEGAEAGWWGRVGEGGVVG